MKKKITILILAVMLVFSCSFDVIYPPDEYESELTFTDVEQTDPDTIPVLPWSEQEGTDQPVIEGPVQEDPIQPVIEEPVQEEPIQPEPVYSEPELPTWQDMNEDQVRVLTAIYKSMTGTGKNLSGWFAEGDYEPCTWQGVSCENGNITGLSFSNAGYFKTFPDAVLELKELKELHMVDTLIRGPLPDSLFEELHKLEVLELSGNFLTGNIPALPNAFAVYPMLKEITISDNLDDDFNKMQMLNLPEYSDIAYYHPEAWEFPETDLEPGLDGGLPEDWDRLPMLTKIDLSGNRLSGQIPESYGQIPLTELDLTSNGSPFTISKDLYKYWLSLGYMSILADDLQVEGGEEEPTEEPVIEYPTDEPTPEPVFEFPTEEPTPEPVFEFPTEEPTPEPVFEFPTEEPTPEPVFIFPPEKPTPEPVFVFPTEEPTPEPVFVFPVNEPTAEHTFDYQPERPPKPFNPPPERPTAVPTRIRPTQVPPTPIIIVVTATPVPQWYTATPQTYYEPYYPPYYPVNPPPQNPPYPGYQQPGYQQPGYQQPGYYPTATPYTYTNPNWIYPTATSYPQYYQKPTAAAPTQNPASQFGFTYKLAEMTSDTIPMTWRYTGMRDYSITYLDASGNLYPYYGMVWTSASELCNSSVCNADVKNIPDELLQGGTFSLQLRARDASGNTYISEPVTMQVSLPTPTPVPTPEPQRSFLGGFFHWLFGPLIRLFGGK